MSKRKLSLLTVLIIGCLLVGWAPYLQPEPELVIQEWEIVPAMALEPPAPEVFERKIPVVAVVEDSPKLFKELPTKTGGAFKTFMHYETITNKSSKQWALQQLAYTDEQGFRRIGTSYLVAMGTFYSTEVGQRFLVTLDSGEVISVFIGDIKQDAHTDKKRQYVPVNGNIVEFIVDTDVISRLALKLGDVSVLGLQGKIISIEEMTN